MQIRYERACVSLRFFASFTSFQSENSSWRIDIALGSVLSSYGILAMSQNVCAL